MTICLMIMLIGLPILSTFVAGIIAGALRQRAGYDRDRNYANTDWQ